MTVVTVAALLLTAAGVLGYLCSRDARAAGESGTTRIVAADDVVHEVVSEVDDGARLLDTLDLAEIPAVVWCPVDQSMRVNETTRSLLAALGASCRGDLSRLPARHIDSGEPVTHADLEALADGERHRMALWIGDGEEGRMALELRARPVREGQSGVLLVGHDVTAEHAAMQTRGDLVAALSHDMRSALTSTIGYVALVTDDPTLSREHRDRLEIALKGVNQTLHLMADLRAAREPGRGSVQLSVNPAACDLAEVLDEALTSLRPSAEGRRISVSVDSPRSLPIVADPLRLRQVIDNVLLNAVKHNRADGWVDITVRPDSDDVRVEVTNSGATLAPSEQDRVFDRYYRSEASRRSGTRGMGLGLNVVKQVVERHGGSVRIASCPDLDTTTLVMRLPLAPTSSGPTSSGSGLPAATNTSEEVRDVDTRHAETVAP